MKTNDGILKEMVEEEKVQFFIEIVLSEGSLANILFVRTCLEIMNRKCGYNWDFQLFGRMVYFASSYRHLGINPATENVDWDMFLSFFGVAPTKKQQAKNEWSRIGKIKNTELCYDAEKLKNIFNS